MLYDKSIQEFEKKLSVRRIEIQESQKIIVFLEKIIEKLEEKKATAEEESSSSSSRRMAFISKQESRSRKSVKPH